MPQISKQALEVYTRAIKARRPKIKLSRNWEFAHQEWRVGRLDNGYLHMTRDDYFVLREMLATSLGRDPLDLDLTSDRNSVAAQISDEKFAKESPSQFLAFVIMTSGGIPTIQGEAMIPPGSALMVDVRTLNMDEISGIVVVENLDSFMQWHQYRAPDIIKNDLAVYRGHDYTARSVKWLCSQRKDTRLTAFTDYDMAGAHIAATLGSDYWMVPEQPGLLVEQGLDKKEPFFDQHSQNKRNSDLIPESWHPACDFIIDNETTLTQQGMLAFDGKYSLIKS